MVAADSFPFVAVPFVCVVAFADLKQALSDVKESINQASNQSSKQSIKQAINQASNQASKQSIKQAINQASNQSSKQSIKQALCFYMV